MAYNGKVAVVTGGGSGMGRVAAQYCAKAGAKVAIIDVNDAGMAETVSGHDGIRAFNVDITSFDAVQACIDTVESEMGPIDRIYNCAAIMPFGKLLEQDAAVQHKLMDINVGGLINIARAGLPKMIGRGAGEFISFASMAGVTPALLMGAYCATKSAVCTYTEILYHENRDSGVKFANVCPPPVATPLLKQGMDTAWPKLMQAQEGKEMTPADVVAWVENSLDKDEFWVFPGKGTKMGYIMRRLFPNYIWNYVHKLEGW